MFDTSRVERPGPVAGLVLERTDPTSLSNADLIAYTRAAERQAAHAQAVALQAVATLADRAEAVSARSHNSACAARARRRGLDAPEPEELAARAAVDQVRQTLRLSAMTATNRIDLARALTRGPLTALGAALAGGQVTLAHARVAQAHTEGRDPDLVRDMLTRTLPRASRQTPGDFGKSLARAELTLDPTGSADRAREAVRDRTGVHHYANPDSTGTLALTASEPETEWAFTVLDTLARAELRGHGIVLAERDGSGEQDHAEAPVDNNGVLATHAARPADSERTSRLVDNNGVPTTTAARAGLPADLATDLDRPTGSVDNYGVLAKAFTDERSQRPSLSQLRAQVLLRLLETAAARPDFPTTHGKRRVETQVVLTLDTLLGLRDDPACVNGRPVPGPIARELADGAGALRRLVTDPVEGHLLDFGDAFPVPPAGRVRDRPRPHLPGPGLQPARHSHRPRPRSPPRDGRPFELGQSRPPLPQPPHAQDGRADGRAGLPSRRLRDLHHRAGRAHPHPRAARARTASGRRGRSLTAVRAGVSR